MRRRCRPRRRRWTWRRPRSSRRSRNWNSRKAICGAPRNWRPASTISARALEKAKLDVTSAEAAVASAVATLEVRRRELESARAHMIQPGEPTARSANCCIEVRSPIDGRVLKIIAESEQVVQPGAPLVELGDPRDLEIVVDFLSRDAVRIKPGAPARIESWGGDTTLHARVKRIEPTGFTKVSALGIEEQRVKVILDFTGPADAWRQLGHGYRIIARVVVWHSDDCPAGSAGRLVPRRATIGRYSWSPTAARSAAWSKSANAICTPRGSSTGSSRASR